MLSSNRELHNYEEACEEFSWDYYRDLCDWDARDDLNLAHEAVGQHADDRTSLAFIWVDEDGSDEKYTFWEMDQESSKIANVLDDIGVGKGDRIYTYMPRLPEHYFSILGSLKTGAVFGAVDRRYSSGALNYRLNHAEATTVITTPEHRETVREATEDVDSIENVLIIDRDGVGVDDEDIDLLERKSEASDEFETVRTAPDDLALLHYTSGTTGPAKGVVHGHKFILGNMAFTDIPCEVDSGDIYWTLADPGWLAGMHPLGIWATGGVQLIYNGDPDLQMWAHILDKYPVSSWYAVPTALRLFMEHEEILADVNLSLGTIISMGEALNAPVAEWAKDALGAPVLDAYGTSETYGMVVSNFKFMDVKPGSMGRPHPGIDVKVVEPGTLEEVEQGEVGEVVVDEYPSQFLEYWQDEEKTNEKRRDGWVSTDDLVEVDEDGYFWYKGRADDVIISSGYRIGPTDIESTLVDHEAVAEAAVVPKPDETRGNIIKAYLVPSESADTSTGEKEALQEYVSEELAAHKKPREIEFVDELPKTLTGKIQRKELRDKAEGEVEAA